MPEHAIVNPIGALASIPARVKGRNKLRGGKGRIIGRIRGEGERDRGAFMERLESKEVRREVGAATDLAEIGPKCSSDLQRVRDKGVEDVEDWSRRGRMLARKFMDTAPDCGERGGRGNRRNIAAPTLTDGGADSPPKAGRRSLEGNERRKLAGRATFAAVAAPGRTLQTQCLGAIRIPPRHALGRKRPGRPGDSRKGSTEDRNSKEQKHIRGSRKERTRKRKSGEGGKSAPVSFIKAPPRGVRTGNIRSGGEEDRKVVAGRELVQDRPVEVQTKGGRAEGKIKAGKGLGAHIKMRGTVRIEKDKVGGGKEALQGAAARVGGGVTPKGVAAIKITHHQ